MHVRKSSYVNFHSVYWVFASWRISFRLPGVDFFHEPVAGEPIPLDGMKPLLITLCHLEVARQGNIALQAGIFWHIKIDDSHAGT